MKHKRIINYSKSKRGFGHCFSFCSFFLLVAASSFSLLSVTANSGNSTNADFSENSKVARSDCRTVEEENLNEYLPTIYDTVFRSSSISRSDKYITFSSAFFEYGTISDQTESFILGYYNQNNPLPLRASYKVKTSGHKTEERWTDLPQVAQSLYPDLCGIGPQFGSGTLSFSYTLELAEDETMDMDSIVLHNIILLKEGQKVPTLSDPLRVFSFALGVKAHTNFRGRELTVRKQSDLFSMNFDSFSTIGSYTSVQFAVDVVADMEDYKSMNQAAYSIHEDNIEKGKFRLGFMFSGVVNTVLTVTYKDGSSQNLNFRGTSPSIGLRVGKNTIFLLTNKINMEEVTNVTLNNLMFVISLYSIENSAMIANTNGDARFGIVSYDIGTPVVNNVNVHLIVWAIVFVIAYIGGSVGLYFYQKNKYKNDEFRRMNTKKYIKTASLGFVASGALLFTILCVAFRAIFLSNSTTVFNPLDIPIIIFGLISIIMVGYFAKFFLNLYKAKKTKKMVDELKLSDGNDKDDDGTK